MKRSFTLAALLAAVAVLAGGCNTVQGLGKDISSVGRKGEEIIEGR